MRLVSRVILVLASTASASVASAQTRYVKIDRIPAGDARAIEVSATDSDVVSVKVVGGKYPLVAQSSPDNARHWAAETAAAAAHAKGGSAAHERHEFGHLSDILVYQRVESGGQLHDVVAIDIGPQNLKIYEYDIPMPILEQLTRSMRRAAAATDSLSRSRRKRSPVSAKENRTPPATQPRVVARSAAERCSQASAMRPIAYSDYVAGTNLDKLIQPPLQTGSPVPAYPRSAIGARVTGEVPARFVINTEGRPDVETFRLRGVANPLFVQSVCDALTRMRFVPSRVKGHPLKQLVDETFIIAPPNSKP